MKRFSILLLLAAIVIGSIVGGWNFRAANLTSVDLDLLWLRIPNLELWRVLLLSTGFGATLASLVWGFFWLRRALLTRRYRKAIGRLEAEIHQLRSLPLADEPGSAGASPGSGVIPEPEALGQRQA